MQQLNKLKNVSLFFIEFYTKKNKSFKGFIFSLFGAKKRIALQFCQKSNIKFKHYLFACHRLFM